MNSVAALPAIRVLLHTGEMAGPRMSCFVMHVASDFKSLPKDACIVNTFPEKKMVSKTLVRNVKPLGNAKKFIKCLSEE